MAEAFDTWRKGREDLREELADMAIYLLGLAEMTDVDLQDKIAAGRSHQLPSVRARHWERNPLPFPRLDRDVWALR